MITLTATIAIKTSQRNSEARARSSAAENDAAEAVQSDVKIHATDNECGQNFAPDNWEIGLRSNARARRAFSETRPVGLRKSSTVYGLPKTVQNAGAGKTAALGAL